MNTFNLENIIPGCIQFLRSDGLHITCLFQELTLKKLYCTDANDVYITKSPFDYLDNPKAIYVGRDQANKIKDSGWLLAESTKFETDANVKIPSTYQYQNVYNAGVVGAHKNTLQFFIYKLMALVIKTKTNDHKDMTLVNLVIYKYFNQYIDYKIDAPRLVTHDTKIEKYNNGVISGYPLNSPFKSYDFNSDAYFIHK